MCRWICPAQSEATLSNPQDDNDPCAETGCALVVWYSALVIFVEHEFPSEHKLMGIQSPKAVRCHESAYAGVSIHRWICPALTEAGSSSTQYAITACIFDGSPQAVPNGLSLCASDSACSTPSTFPFSPSQGSGWCMYQIKGTRCSDKCTSIL